MLGILVLLATLIALIFYRAAQRPPNFPPGPLSLPIIGSVLSILPSAKESFKKFQKKYGDICAIKVFNNWGVLISDPTLMRTTGADLRYSGRPPLYIFTARNVFISGKEEPLGIIGTSGDVWKHQRRFTLRSLKDKGFGRNSIEPIMQNELAELGDYFASQRNKKISVGYTFNRSIVNVLWALVMGKRFTYDDDRLQELVDKITKMIQSFDPFHPALNFPFIKKLFPNLDIYQKVDGYMKDLLDYIEDQLVDYHKEMGDNDDSECYVGNYLKEIKDNEKAGKESTLNLHHLKANVVELFFAGSETTSSTLWWAMYLIASHPKIQEKMQEELDQVVGPGNLPTFEHIDSLPYTTATMYEIQRYGDLVPFGVPHKLLDDVEVGGFHLPKGTDVSYNLTYAHKSPKYWKYPEKFYPEHFLTPEGKVYKPDAFLPFGHGKRVCLGESLARLEFFLFLTNLVHRFHWKMSEDPVTWDKGVLINNPPNFTVYVTRRGSANG